MWVGGGYAFALVCNNYYFIVENTCLKPIVDWYMHIFISARNGIFVGFIFICIGIYMGIKCDELLTNANCLNFQLMAALGLLIIEIFVLKDKTYIDDGALYISHLVVAPLLLAFLLQLKLEINSRISRLLRNWSSGVYFLHRLIMQIVELCERIIGIQMDYIIFVGFVVGLSILICTLSYRSKNCFINLILR